MGLRSSRRRSVRSMKLSERCAISSRRGCVLAFRFKGSFKRMSSFMKKSRVRDVHDEPQHVQHALTVDRKPVPDACHVAQDRAYRVLSEVHEAEPAEVGRDGKRSAQHRVHPPARVAGAQAAVELGLVDVACVGSVDAGLIPHDRVEVLANAEVGKFGDAEEVLHRRPIQVFAYL